MTTAQASKKLPYQPRWHPNAGRSRLGRVRGVVAWKCRGTLCGRTIVACDRSRVNCHEYNRGAILQSKHLSAIGKLIGESVSRRSIGAFQRVRITERQIDSVPDERQGIVDELRNSARDRSCESSSDLIAVFRWSIMMDSSVRKN